MPEPKLEHWECKCCWCGRRLKRLAVCLFFAFLVAFIWLHQEYMWEEEEFIKGTVKCDPRLMLWWNAYDKNLFQRNIYSGHEVCTITNDRQKLEEAKVIFFLGSNITANDMPLPRQPWQLWALLHAESPQDQEILLYETFMQHFNYTSTFSRYSDFPLTLSELSDAHELIKSTYLLPLRKRHLNPVLFMQNNCDTMSGRENYVRELMSYVLVYSCGKCLRNSDPPSLKEKDDLLRFVAQFKFILAFEDAICDDYITSTYWLALTVGAIPIYFGSPTIRDWEPHNHSTIYISDYKSPQELANYITYLEGNETAFNEYLHHKYDQIEPITNSHLLNGLIWRTNARRTNRFKNFEKEMCREINRVDIPKRKIANRTHMDCQLPQPYPSAFKYQTQHANQWKTKLAISKCTAYLLDKRLRINKPDLEKNFTMMLQALVGSGFC